jgi:hypothetical protein
MHVWDQIAVSQVVDHAGHAEWESQAQLTTVNMT